VVVEVVEQQHSHQAEQLHQAEVVAEEMVVAVATALLLLLEAQILEEAVEAEHTEMLALQVEVV
jgi:hypothetical protein